MSNAKQWIKQVVPEPVRDLRYALGDKLRYYPELFYSLGRGLECPFCGGRFRRFLTAGFDYPVLTAAQVTTGGRRSNVVCPRCHSNPRERLLYLYIQRYTDLLSRPSRLLHVAPEPELQRVLRSSPAIVYIRTDLDCHPNMRISCRSDLTRLPFSNEAFDVVLCNHVLEHVPDDRQAMRELFRILKPGGWSVLQVPIAMALQATYENPAITDDAGRIREFGQKDHVRLYALDYLDRLRDAGFTIRIFNNPREFGPEATQKYGLDAGEDLYICSKPA